jgi:hypothetical protein
MCVYIYIYTHMHACICTFTLELLVARKHVMMPSLHTNGGHHKHVHSTICIHAYMHALPVKKLMHTIVEVHCTNT